MSGVVRIAIVATLIASGLIAQPAFEVATVKTHVFSGASGSVRMGVFISGNRVTISVQSLNALIATAYNVRAYQVSGGPDWAAGSGASFIYDIAAKAEGEARPTMDQVREMLQTLLAERFQLKLHREMKEVPVYVLVVGKSGSKMKESAADAQPGMRFRSGSSQDMTVSKGSIEQLTARLSASTGRPVLDMTGLKGAYDYKLEWTNERASEHGSADVATDAGGPSIFTAIQEQLGLRLESRKGPIEILVIDRAEKPSEN
jgi:uncharacterized protein (TIGR03435 family)